jgi:hypothetical protein
MALLVVVGVVGSIMTSERELLYRNASCPMDFTFSGITMDVNLLIPNA